MTDVRRSDESVVRDAIGELRLQDALHVPAFAAVLGSSRETALERRARGGAEGAERTMQVVARRRRIVVATSLAAALAVVVSAGYWLARPRRLVMPSEVETLSAWTSPTDALLRGARMHLITQAPRLGASMVDTLRGELR